MRSYLSALRSVFTSVGRHLRRGAPAYAVLLISLLLTAVAWYYARQSVEQQSEVRFDETVRATQAAIDRRIFTYLDSMYGAGGLFYASETVDPQEWNEYVKGIEPASRFEGLQVLSYAEYVTAQERKAFEQRAKEEGLPEIRPDLHPGGERPAYFPIIYVGPIDEANASMLGYDYYAEAKHREAMDRARDTGSPQTTEMVYVMTDPSAPSSADLALQPGFHVYLPVYRKGEPQGTVDERRRALEGFVVGAFRTDELFADVFGGTFDPSIDFEVYDGAHPALSPLLYDNDGVRRAGRKVPDSLFTEESQIDFAGRQLSLYFATLAAFEEEAQSRLPTFVLAGGVAISIVLFGITWVLLRIAVENARLLVEVRGKAALEERQRLARELHDSVSQALYGIALGAKTARKLLDQNPDRAADPLEYVSSLADAGLAEMRALIFELRPESLQSEGLVAALDKQAAALRARHGINVETDLCNEPDIPLEGKEALYRIAQEALHNTTKHARASRIQIRMQCSPKHVNLEICDDGIGFDPRGNFPGHLGLRSMRERIERLGGTLAVESAPGKGTDIRAWMPI
ncbi:MAG TPA: CHASE domain-containing protein [Rubrobacteraceae bacterium]|nr:CHASE domain-containing protein [Rubrobacteraceae bacterium]